MSSNANEAITFSTCTLPPPLLHVTLTGFFKTKNLRLALRQIPVSGRSRAENAASGTTWYGDILFPGCVPEWPGVNLHDYLIVCLYTVRVRTTAGGAHTHSAGSALSDVTWSRLLSTERTTVSVAYEVADFKNYDDKQRKYNYRNGHWSIWNNI